MGWNPFTKSFWNGVGDKVAGTFTLGHCDHSGCSSGNRQEQLAAVAQQQAQQQAQQRQQQQQQQVIQQLQGQVRQLLMFGLALVAAFVGLELLLDVIFWLVDVIFWIL